MRIGWLIGIAGIAATVWLAASGEAARAELRVMESNAPTIEVDAVFPDDAAFDIPAGKKVKLLKAPANTTHEIAGPYQGTLDAYQPACGVWQFLHWLSSSSGRLTWFWPVAKLTSSWQEPQAAWLGLVFQLSACLVKPGVWQTVQLRISCGNTMSEKSLMAPRCTM